MVNRHTFLLATALSLLEVLALAAAHGHDSHATGAEGRGSSEIAQSTPPPNLTVPVTMSTPASPSSYFSHAPHSGLMLAHIFVMTVAWFFILPVGESKRHTSSWSRLGLRTSFARRNA